ncbi:MAG: hypothetical protein HN798_09885, partial [Chloroflexi bacterium]|nr:hypothetical protein [Chloroflexota bacterium]
MLATPPVAVEKFSGAYESLVAGSSDVPEWLKAVRQQGWVTFSELGLPTKRRGNELWKYTNLQPLAAADFAYSIGGSVTVDQIKAAGPWDDVWNT